jgi:hypothetical protein
MGSFELEKEIVEKQEGPVKTLQGKLRGPFHRPGRGNSIDSGYDSSYRSQKVGILHSDLSSPMFEDEDDDDDQAYGYIYYEARTKDSYLLYVQFTEKGDWLFRFEFKPPASCSSQTVDASSGLKYPSLYDWPHIEKLPKLTKDAQQNKISGTVALSTS